MAKFHKGLKYHEDNVEKHSITDDEIDFLISLQAEMNTQNTVGQADPRYWVIRGTKKEYGVMDDIADGAELHRREIIVANNMEEAMEFIVNNLLSDINKDGNNYTLSFEDDCIYVWDDKSHTATLANMSGVVEWLEGHGYYYFSYMNYYFRKAIYHGTMFLTQKDAENHLRANHYHYSDDAHTYAMTSWRSEISTKLWKILQEVNWKQLLK